MAQHSLCPALVAVALWIVVGCVPDADAVRARVQTRLAAAEATATLATPRTTPTATAPVVRWYVVGNTGGDGVYIRRTPRLADRIVAWPDGTRMESLMAEEYAEGRLWRRVRDPRGNVGWVPAEYLIALPSAAQPTPRPASREAEELYSRVPEARGASVRLGLDLLIVDFGPRGQVSPQLEAQLLDWYLVKAPGLAYYEMRVRAGVHTDGEPIERIWRWDVQTSTLRLAETAPPGAPPFDCWRWDGMTAEAIRRAATLVGGWGPGRSDRAWCGLAPLPTPTRRLETATATLTPGPRAPTATPWPTQPPGATPMPTPPTPRP